MPNPRPRIAALLGLLAAPMFAQTAPLSPGQRAFIGWRFGMFVHFNLATSVGTDWAGGYEDASRFDPERLDCGQWADEAKAAGMTYMVLTVKHTEGISLYPSLVTTRDTRMFTKFRGGKADIVGEFVSACRSRGLHVGLYYCFPGDYSDVDHRNAPPAGRPNLHGLPPEAAGDYVGFMERQLSEMLTRYGPIDLLWIDQYANKYTAGRWPAIFAYLKSIQPHCLVLANNARTLKDSEVISFEFPWKGDLPPVDNTLPSEVCDTIQTGARWFWRASPAPTDLRPAREIVGRLEECNRRDANYLLDVPPDPEGLISGPQLARLRDVGALARAYR